MHAAPSGTPTQFEHDRNLDFIRDTPGPRRCSPARPDRIGWSGETALTVRLARAHHVPCSRNHRSTCSSPRRWSSAACSIQSRQG